MTYFVSWDEGTACLDPRLACLPCIQLRPYSFAYSGLTHSPLAGQGIHEHEPETRPVEPDWGARLRPARVSVVDLDPQPGSRGFQFQHYRVTARGMPDCVGDQLRYEQDSGLLQVGQPPCGQRVAGSLSCHPHRMA